MHTADTLQLMTTEHARRIKIKDIYSVTCPHLREAILDAQDAAREDANRSTKNNPTRFTIAQVFDENNLSPLESGTGLAPCLHCNLVVVATSHGAPRQKPINPFNYDLPYWLTIITAYDHIGPDSSCKLTVTIPPHSDCALFEEDEELTIKS